MSVTKSQGVKLVELKKYQGKKEGNPIREKIIPKVGFDKIP